jgi:LPXTG-motif cell wall-anchored protein
MGTASTGRASRIGIAIGASAVMIGLGAGPVAAQDQHSGGVSPNQQVTDPGEPSAILGQSESRGGGLPVTGSDVAGLAGIGAVAVAAGAGAVAASKRRTRISG